MRREPWKLKDVVMMAILGVLFAVVYMAVFYGGTAHFGGPHPPGPVGLRL